MEKLFFSLYNADSEEEVKRVIESSPILSNPNNWKPYGGDRNNFSTFQNQQSEPVPALVEKVTNAIDAVLLKEIKLKNIDPESLKAPRNTKKAVELIFDLPSGNWEYADERFKRSVAEKIQLMTTGDKKTPSITVFDDGEGQHPDDFEDTFLSLHKGNKVKIPFVQGKYNMGSTGAVVFCGENNYQLIASKKAHGLIDREDNDFGFTLVRKHNLTEEEENICKSTWYEYFTVNDKIARFSIESLDIGLAKNQPFHSGSIIKMYSYDLPPRIRSSISFDFYREMNLILYHPSIPILLIEGRKEYQLENPYILMEGNKTRLFRDKNKKLENTFSFQLENDSYGNLSIDVFLLKADVKRRDYIRNHSVLFTVNGQAQGYETKGFISQDLNFPMLKDSILIHIDCTDLKTSFRNDLFMSSRDRLKNSSKKQFLMNDIIQVLKSNNELRNAHDIRRNAILNNDKIKNETIEKIASRLPIQKELLNLLKKGTSGQLSKKKKQKKDKRVKSIETNFHPTFFTLSSADMKKIPLGGKGYIVFTTDAPEDFFIREKDKGFLKSFVVKHKRGKQSLKEYELDEANKVFDVEISGPFLGQILLSLAPKQEANLKVNDTLEMLAKLVFGDKELDCNFSICLDNKVGRTKRKSKNKNDSNQLDLPKAIQVHQEDWHNYHWNGEDVLQFILEHNEIKEPIISAIAINMDCHPFKKFLSVNKFKTETQLKAARDQFFSIVYFQALFQFATMKDVFVESNIKVDLDDVLKEHFKHFVSFLISYHMNADALKSLNEKIG